MRVLLLTETYRPEIGGGERQARLLARGLIRHGHGVTILTRRSRPELARRDRDGEIRVVRAPPAGRGRRRKWMLLFTTLPALLRMRSQYDILLVSGFRILAVPALLAGALFGKPVVLKADSNGELSGEFFRAGLRGLHLAPDSVPVRAALAVRNRLIRRAAAFVAIAADIEREMLDSGVPPNRVHCIPNGVDMESFRPATESEKLELRRRLGLPGGRVAIYTGRLVSYKGLPLLLHIWLEMAAALEDVTLVLVGEGSGDMHDCEKQLRAEVAAHESPPSVRFTGAVENVEDWLRAADIFVFPTHSEAFGLSLVEAMACGLAVVTTVVGGIKDFIEDGVNALAIEPGDARGLGRGLRLLARDHERAARLGKAARETVLWRFGEDAIAGSYENLFASLLRARAAELGA